MSKYYYLVSGLPNISFDGSKLPFKTLEFQEELVNHISRADMRLLHILYLKVDNQNLLEQLQYSDWELNSGGIITIGEIHEFLSNMRIKCEREKEGNYESPVGSRMRENHIPPYFELFTNEYFESLEKDDPIVIPWEDRLSSLYYQFAMKCKNRFIASWFELNLNIQNIFTALTCRKFGLDRTKYIVGDTELSNMLRFSTERDFDIDDSFQYGHSVLRIAEDADLLQREWKIDQLKWEWLDEQTFVKVFDIESVLAYMLKLEILERWARLDKATGENLFRQFVGAMKRGSGHTLEEFNRNNKK